MTNKPDWIHPGADVVVHTTADGLQEYGGVRRDTVATVAGASFTLTADPDMRFRFDTLQSKGCSSFRHPYRFVVEPAGSDLAVELLRIKARNGPRTAAMSAVDKWDTGHGRDDPAKLDAAIEALTVYRRHLAGDADD